MKLLGWMHRKFKQNSSEPLKDFAIGNACACPTGQQSLDDQQCFHPKSNYGGNKPFKKDNYFRKSLAGLESPRADEDQDQDYYYEDEPPAAAISDLFDGFLAIGTLGANPNVPSTPTFGTSVDNITEKATEVTENKLKLINDELEKVLVAETNKEDGYNYDSSARNSHVSNGRSSHGSSITLGGKSTDCPLQGYLFGSAIEMSETTTTTAVPKKENRTSLGELFQKTKVMEDPKEEKRILENNYKEGGTGDKSAVHSIMKKMLKKKMLHPSAETKLHKILQMFNRKVHPESSATMKKADKAMKRENKKSSSTCHELEHHENVIGGGGGHDQMDPDDDQDILIFPHTTAAAAGGSLSKEMLRRYKSQSNPPHFSFGASCCDSNGNREHWIKTDADYLVLEL